MKNHTFIDRIIFIGIIFLLVFAPLAFGAVHVWAYCLVIFGVVVLLLLWFADRLILSPSAALEWVKTPVNLFLALLLLVIGIQMLPLPSDLVALLSPKTYAVKIKAMEILEQVTGTTSGSRPWLTLSHYLFPTRLAFAKLFAYVGMFFLVLNTLKSKKHINILVITIMLVGLFEALYALFQVTSGTPRVWWWKSRIGQAGWASGTFVGSNHFAGYMELAVCITLGFFIAQKPKTRRLLSGLDGLRTRLQRIVAGLSPESSRPRSLLFFFMAVVMGTALFLSASRGGILALGVAMMFMAGLFLFKRRYRKYGVLSLFFCVISISYSLLVGIDATLAKFERTDNRSDRFQVTRTVLPMIRDYPVTGVGWGNFQYVYPRYIDDVDWVASTGHAHNDWVEAGTETGFPGLILIGLAYGVFLYRMIRIWRKRRDLYAVGVGAGVLVALISIGIHSFFDLNMHIPANPLTLAVILGIGNVVIHRRGHGDSQSFFYPVNRIPLTRIRRAVLMGIVGLVSLAVLMTVFKHFSAEVVCPTVWNSTMNLNWDPEREDIEKAIARDTGNTEYHYLRARHLIYKEPETAEKGPADKKAIQSLATALRHNPVQGTYWYMLGERFARRNDNLYDYVEKWLPLADQCFDQGIFCAPKDPYILFHTAIYWVWRSRMLPEKEGNGVKAEAIRKFQTYFQRVLEIQPDFWKKAMEAVWSYYKDDAIVLGIVPENQPEMQQRVLRELAKHG